jgi:SAM-dependent methyltransferase
MVSTIIDPRDEMYRYSVSSLSGNEEAGRRLYFEKGRQIADAVVQIADRRPGGRRGVRALLDFASGYGRATRYLVDSWPAQDITVCDIQAEGVAFQTRSFGVVGAASAGDPGGLRFAGRFDMICAASFFSHVPPSRFEGWVARLAEFLGHDGTLVFSTNPLRTRADVNPVWGVQFEPTSESEVLVGEDYGTTWVSEEYVRAAACAAGFASDRVELLPRGLCGHQDLWVLQSGDKLDLEGFAGYPVGDVIQLDTREGIFHVEGWARDWRPGGRISAIELDVGEPRPRAIVGGLEQDGYVRWRLDLDLADFDLDELVGIEARNDQGRSNLIALGSLRPFVEGA